MIRKVLVCGTAAAFLLCGLAFTSLAGDTGPETITLTATGSAKPKPATFPHKKHQETLKCGECHHGMQDGKQVPYAEGMAIGKCERLLILNEKETKLSKSLIKTHQQQLNGETGLGWILPSNADKLLGNESIVWHNGMAGGYASFLAIDKKNNYGVIVLSNKAVDVTKLGMKIAIAARTQSWKNN